MGQVVDSTVRVRPTGGAGPGTRVAGLDGSPRRIESLRPSERRNAFARRMARHCAKVNGFCPDAILARDNHAHGDQRRTMTLSAMEFLRRLVQHILPRGFVRIRQSGFLANTCRAARVPLARTILAPRATAANSSDATPTMEAATGLTWACPRCAAMTIGPILSALHLAAVTLGFDTS